MAGKFLTKSKWQRNLLKYGQKKEIWDIKSQIYKVINAKFQSYRVFKEKPNMEGKYLLFTWLKIARKSFLGLKFYNLF